MISSRMASVLLHQGQALNLSHLGAYYREAPAAISSRRNGNGLPFQEMGNVRCNVVEVRGSQSAFIWDS